MKIFIPQTKEEITLKKNWIVNLSKETIKIFFGVDIKEKFKKFNVPVGTKLYISKYNLYNRRTIDIIEVMFSEYQGKKLKVAQYHAAMIELKDFNRIYIEDSDTQGAMHVEIFWTEKKHSRKGYLDKSLSINDVVYEGKVNDELFFKITISDIEIYSSKSSYGTKTYKVKDIKYVIEENVSKKGRWKEIGEWSTTQTCRKKAMDFLNSHKNVFLDDTQSILMRKEKMKRLDEEIKTNRNI